MTNIFPQTLADIFGIQSERQDADGGREFLRASHRDEAMLGAGNAVGTYSPISFIVSTSDNREVIMTQRLNPSAVATEGYAALRRVEAYLQASGLDHKLILLVKTRVSQMNGCAYCLHMHTQEALKLGESDVRLFLLDAWHESNLYSERERAALAWAESLTNIAISRAPDDVYDEARRQFSEKELADLSIVIAMINAWNRLAIGSRTVHPADVANAA